MYAQAGIGGMSEVMTAFEEYCVPVSPILPAAQLTLLGDQLASGFAAGHADMHFQPGSDVVVFGAGPVGLGAVQAGRVMGAGQVIVVDPIKYRREFAMKVGATTTLDPNAEGDGIVERIRELCRGPNDRRFAGGVSWGRAANAVMSRGADFVVEAAGYQAHPPKVETQPDPTNVKTVQQAWDCTRAGGHVMLMGFTLQQVSFPGPSLAIFGRTIHPGQQGGLHVMRDIPRYVKLIEEGRDRREVGDHEDLHTRRQPAGRGGHRRADDHHRRHRVQLARLVAPSKIRAALRRDGGAPRPLGRTQRRYARLSLADPTTSDLQTVKARAGTPPAVEDPSRAQCRRELRATAGEAGL